MEVAMAKVLIKVDVAFPGNFKKTLEAQAEDRHKRGERSFSSGVDDEQRNFVYAILDWESVRSAKRFWSSSEAKAQMSDWHSVCTPEIVVLRESPED
jgi:hypothetical protein